MNLLDAIELTLKDYIEILPTENKSGLSPSESRIGGCAFLPLDLSHPICSEGLPLFFLAQINFKQVPQMSLFPHKGLLQFFIAEKKPSSLDRKDTFKVIYIPEEGMINFNSKSETSIKPEYPILQEPHSLSFMKKKMSVSVCDYGFNDVYDEMFSSEDQVHEFEMAYFKNYGKITDHRLGGYPSLWHNSLERVGQDEKSNKDVLLLQVPLGDNLFWGGDEILNFFISEEKLSSLDFSEVYFQRTSV